MSQILFDDRVAIVTGAGGGLGKSYAILLASRGASVVVNDLGTSTTGIGTSSKFADLVVEEIKSKGGKAVANYNSVEDGDKIVETAISAFGRVDIVINNAGILRDKTFLKMSDQDWELVCKVHLQGTYKVTKAAWPHMQKNRYGRILMISSAAGLYGNYAQSNYSSSKMGILGFGQTLAKEGQKFNILTNIIAPLAGSRMTATIMPEEVVNALSPEYVAPLAAYLVSEENKTNGALFEVGAGWISRLRWERAKGCFFPVDETLTAEAIKRNWGIINDFSQVDHPNSLKDSSSVAYQNIQNKGKNKGHSTSSDKNNSKPNDTSTNSVPLSSDSAELIFDRLSAFLTSNTAIADAINGIIEFDLDIGNNSRQSWSLDFKSKPPLVTKGSNPNREVTLIMNENTFVSLMNRKLNAQDALLQGKLKIKGNMSLAFKLEVLIKAIPTPKL